jgi:hypothetical protein
VARRPLEKEQVHLDGGRRTTQLMRDSLGRACPVRTLSFSSLATAILLSPAVATAQRPALGFTIQHVFDAGPGVERSCLESGHSTGVGGRLSVGVLARFVSVAFTTRAYVLESAATCVDGFPPPDGTYVEDDRIALLAAPFLTTDFRLRVRSGSKEGAPGLALGVGNAWHSSHDLPYVLVGASVPIATSHQVRAVIEAEYLMLRVTSDRYRTTWQNAQVVAIESLGQIHHWSRALTLGAGIEVSF